jgi:hypothetical protein
LKALFCWLAILASNFVVLGLFFQLVKPSDICILVIYILVPVIFSLPWVVIMQKER